MDWWRQRFAPLRWLRGATRRGIRIALAVLLAGLAVTSLVAYGVYTDVRAKAQREFTFACREIQLRIEDRLSAHVQLLTSGAALFDSAETVTRQEWETFVGRLQVDEYLPGILGTGFSVLIAPDKLDAHIEQMRQEGFPAYTVWPQGEREVYSSIIYLVPFTGRNLRAFGYDMFSEPVRRAAMERARDENAAALSGKVILVQETDEDVQAGTLMYVPVYQHGAPLATVEQRRAAIRGWVYSPYRMNDLLSSVLDDWGAGQDKQRTLEVYDGDEIDPAALLYDSRQTANLSPTAVELFTLVNRVENAGRRWSLRCVEYGEPLELVNDTRVWSALSGGVVASILLAGLVLSLYDTHYRARRLAEQLTTELRRSEEKYRERSVQLAEAVAELQRAARTRDEFMAAVSHELRTPLTGILSMAEVLELAVSGALNERQTRYVQAIRASALRLSAVITSILRYTELVAGNAGAHAEPCRLQDLAAAAGRFARPLAEQKGLAFNIAVVPPDLVVVSDTQAISQILEQLLDNAVKFTPAGGSIGLEIHNTSDGGAVELIVWDTGIGIAPDLHGRVFQPFTQGDGSLARRYEGVGLGLAFVQRLVELLKGTITLHSVEGEGSRFTVTLPQR